MRSPASFVNVIQYQRHDPPVLFDFTLSILPVGADRPEAEGMIFVLKRTNPMLSYLRTPMKRSTSLLAACALSISALGASTAPASASDDKLLKLLLGATAVAIIVQSASRMQGQARPAPARGLPQHCRKTLDIHGRHVTVYNAHCLHRAGLRDLPQHCHETIRTNHGMRSIYRARCLEGHAPRRGGQARARGLPDWCATRYQYRGRWHEGYSASCLRHAGLRHLPATCLVSGSGGQVYAAQCLHREGHARRFAPSERGWHGPNAPLRR